VELRSWWVRLIRSCNQSYSFWYLCN